MKILPVSHPCDWKQVLISQDYSAPGLCFCGLLRLSALTHAEYNSLSGNSKNALSSSTRTLEENNRISMIANMMVYLHRMMVIIHHLIRGVKHWIGLTALPPYDVGNHAIGLNNIIIRLLIYPRLFMQNHP